MGSEARKPSAAASRLVEPGFWTYTTLILIALLVAAPLWGPGMVNTRGGGDSPFLLQRAHQMVVNLRAGVFPVRWMPDAAYGLGYPFFSYYAALPFYLTGLLALVGMDLLTALKLVQTLGFIAAGLAMYGWMHRMTRNRPAAWLAAVAYTVAPFHLVNVYVRGDSLSEFYAFIFYPLILWGLDGINEAANRQTDKSLALSPKLAAAGLAYAGLVLTHNLSAAMFSPFALLYLVMLAWRRGNRSWRVLGLGLSALGLGLLLAAWYAFPALAELGQVQLGPSTQDYFHYSGHFRTLNLVQRGLLFDYSITAGHKVHSPFSMGLAQAVLAVMGGLVLVVRGIRRKLETRWLFVLLGLLVSTAMITPLSEPLWDHLPLLPVVQFPWRFLSVQAVFTAAATAALVPVRRTTRPRLATGYRSLVVLAALVLTASVLIPLHPDRLPVDPGDVTVERLQLYELFAGNIGTTIRYEWLPRTANPRPFTSDALVDPGASLRAIPLDSASLEAALVESGPTHQEWRVWGGGGDVAFPLLYWPGWQAQVDGDPVEVWPVEGSGYLALEVPPGEHTVLLCVGRTPARAVAEAASLCATVILVVVLVRVRTSIRWPFVIRRVSIIILPLLALLLLPRGTFNSDTDLTMDFVQMPYLHHNPDGVDFDGASRLAGYTLSAEELAPGDVLTITFDWSRTDGAHTATVRLVSPAAVRYDVEPLAEMTCRLQAATCNSVALRLPDDIPRGIYLLQLRLFGPEGELGARTSGGPRQGTLYLRPVRVPHGPPLPPDVSVLARFDPAIRLHAASVAQLAPDRLAVRLDWSAARSMAVNYGISLRLIDADRQIREQLDTQPGYGFLPTSLWRPGELFADRYVLALPDDLPAGEGYELEVILYQTSTLKPVGQARLGAFPLPMEQDTPFEARRPPRTFLLPPLQYSSGAEFGGEVRLAGYDLTHELEPETLRLTLWWQALQMPQTDYTVFVHLFDPATEYVAVQSDAQPRDGTYPTSWWITGEVVSDTVTLPLADVSEGTYRLAVGLYDQTVTRLQAIGPDGRRLVNDRLVLPVDIAVDNPSP